MLHVVQSQRIELLVAGLIDFFAHQPIGVFESRQILIPSHGVGMWLRYQLADQDGICAQLSTDFIGSYQWKLYSKILELKKNKPEADTATDATIVDDLTSEKSEGVPLSANVMHWRIFSFLYDLQTNPAADAELYQEFEILLDRIKDGTPTQIRRQIWGLSEQISQVFAAYVVYRPEWLRLWGRGQKLNLQALFDRLPEPPPKWQYDHYLATQPWQAKLWQVLFAEVFAARELVIQQFWDTLARDPKKRRDLPSSLAVFSMVQLPPAELNFLKQLSQYTQIQLLHYNPSQEYWADSVDPRWLSWYAQKYPERAALRDSRHPLLTRLGKQARDVFGLLSGMSGGDYGDWQDVFPDAYPPTLLGHIQHDILQLNDPSQQPKIVLADDDQSVVVHVCHSALRQLEVLREELLTWLAQDVRRQPADVLVLAPNIQALAPLIRAVFAPSLSQPNLNIPFEIVGLPTPSTQALWQALKGCFDLLDGRFGHDVLLDWLGLPAVQQAYAVSREQVQRMGDLLIAAGFKRGFDALHLSQTLSDQDTDTRYTFRFALDRLLLGMVLPTEVVYADVLAWPSVQPDDFVLIVTLQKIYEQLNDSRQISATESRTVGTWLRQLRDRANSLFPKQIEGEDWKTIKYLFKSVLADFAATDVAEPQVRLNAVLASLDQGLQRISKSSKPFGKLSFARLGTLRPLPYQLVVMLGLEAGQFPVRDPISNFDLIKALPAQVGDRSRQEDELGAFLDGLLLAQQACWMFYNGFDVADVHPRQPAAPVQELLDLLASQLQAKTLATDSGVTRLETASEVLERCVLRKHSLLPFERDNFLPADPQQPRQSYTQPRMLADLWYQVAQQLYTPRDRPISGVWAAAFAQQSLVVPVSPLSLTRIITQLLRPARHFLQQARIQNVYRVEQASTFEPLTLNALDQYQLRQAHLRTDKTLSVALLADRLPVGSAQQAYFLLSEQEARLIERRVLACATACAKVGCDETTERALSLTDQQTGQHWSLLIEVPSESTAIWLAERGNSGRGKHRLRVWLEHLAWQIYRRTSPADVQAGRGTRVVVFSKDSYQLAPISADQATIYLLDWLAVWRQSATQPWVLPPDLVLDSTDGLRYVKSTDSYEYRLDKLIEKWRGKGFNQWITPSEDECCYLHPDWQLLLQGQDAEHAFRQHLAAHAERLYLPLLLAWQDFNPLKGVAT